MPIACRRSPTISRVRCSIRRATTGSSSATSTLTAGAPLRVEVLEGTWEPKRLVLLLEFPSVELAKQWWASEDYADAKTLRQATSSGDMVVIESL